MWMLNPRYMCQKHIVGEHGEIHKHRHNFVKKHSISGRINPVVQIEPLAMKKRHDELAKHMNHKSPYELPDLSHLPKAELNAKVDLEQSHIDLISRCEDFRLMYTTFYQ
jgi:hypothetical protein